MDLAQFTSAVKEIEKVVKPLILSDEQQAILDTFVQKWCHIAIQASAGSGKTFMIVQMINEAKRLWPEKSIAYFVFNTSAREDAQKRIGTGVTISTFHSLGLGWINRYIRKNTKGKPRDYFTFVHENATVNYIVSGLKNGKYGFVKQDDPAFFPTVYRVAGLVNYGKSYNVKSALELQEIAQKHSLDTRDGAISDALRVIKDRERVVKTERKITLDFDDMMYFAANLPADTLPEFEKYDIVFVDEAQDASKVRRLLAEKSLKDHGRMIVVGDIKQAIYGFAGSDSTNFQDLLDDPTFVNLPLTTCYRCSTNVLAAVNTIDPTIQPRTDAPAGFFGDAADISNIQLKDAILCRNNAPLFSYFFKLAKMGIPAYIMGDDVLRYMEAVVKSSQCDNNTDFQNYLDGLATSVASNKNKKKSSGPDMQDIIDSLLMCFEKVSARIKGGRKISNAKQYQALWTGVLKEVFTPKGDAVTLTTIHKSKGGEWLNVYFIRPDLLPSPYAKQAWEQLEEINLRYVAYTRAEEGFYIIKPA